MESIESEDHVKAEYKIWLGDISVLIGALVSGIKIVAVFGLI